MRAGRGQVLAAAAPGEAGVRGRRTGPHCVKGRPGIPSRAVRPRQLPGAAGDWPAPPGPHLPAALWSGSEQATYRASQRKWLEFLPRRLAQASGRAGRGGTGGPCAGAAGSWRGPSGSQPPAPAAGARLPLPEHVKGHRLAPGETAWPSPASSPLTWLWLIWGAVLHPWLMRLQTLSLWDGAQHTSRVDPSEDGAAGLTEASVSPSLCFWKVPAADVSQCSRPAFLACSAGLSLLQVLRARQGVGSVGEADPSGGVSHQVV